MSTCRRNAENQFEPTARTGRYSLRGYRANRFLARSLWFANVEFRTRIADAKIDSQRLGFGLAPYFDAETVRDRWQNLNCDKVKTSYGAGMRIAWNQSTLLSFDYGISREDRLFFFGIGQVFDSTKLVRRWILREGCWHCLSSFAEKYFQVG